MSNEAEKSGIDRTTLIFIVVGAVILIVPGVYVLTASDQAFRTECRERCEKIEMDYKIIPLGASAQLGEYPAECRCVKLEEKRWWQFWR